MITPEEIKTKAINKYNAFLEAYLADQPFFPLIIPANKKPATEYEKFQREITRLVAGSKAGKGYGYTIAYREVVSQKLGRQQLPGRISFESQSDYLRFIGKLTEFVSFQANVKLILNTIPALKDWLFRRYQVVIQNQGKWESLLQVCRYFSDTPRPNLYIRELPVPVHTKFIEENQTVLRELLDQLIPEWLDPAATQFEKRFHLKYNEPQIRILILDPVVAAQSFSGIADLTIRQSDFEQLQLPLRQVIILENKTNFVNIENFLTLPQLPKTAAIFGQGFGLSALKGAAWLKAVQVYYWGDLDAHGFQILAQLRSYFPQTESLMMDWKTLQSFAADWVTGTLTTVEALQHLTPAENEVFNYLKAQNLRLEQEKISHQYATAYIEGQLQQY
jgi:hypothetical protein